MCRLLEDFDCRFIIIIYWLRLEIVENTARLDRHLTLLKLGVILLSTYMDVDYLLELFAHEHVLLGDKSVDFDTVCVVFFL